MAKVIGPGSLIADVTGFAPHLPAAGETAKGTTLRFGPGGKGSNQMTAAHRAGADVKMISCRGNDFLGMMMHDFYVREGMSEEYIRADDSFETGSALIEVSETNAQNRIIVILAANEKVGREAVFAAEKEFSDADAVLAQFETTPEAVLAAKELAKKYHKPFILNPAPCIPMPDGLYDGIDYLTPNETEAELLTGVKVETEEDCRLASEKLFALGVRNVIITLGSRGAYFRNPEKELFIPAVTSVKAIDTTGAGDAFNGGFAAAVAEGLPVEDALKFATCAAAISVTRLGTGPSMPQREEILALLKEEFGLTL
ncbi:MAG: PfkB family carbohydrate kinase [Clostridia bacterium]|nr:PfkB family carbohydrate kinase [Clostridia bacterium]